MDRQDGLYYRVNFSLDAAGGKTRDAHPRGGNMRYINTLAAGDSIGDIYLCSRKKEMTAKTGRPYISLELKDRTGTLDAKIWDPYSTGIDEFEEKDFIYVAGDVRTFNDKLQASLRRVRRAPEGEYDPADYIPKTDKDVEVMYGELKDFIASVKNPYLEKLLISFFGDAEFEKRFKSASAAKRVHHGFMGGLLEHTLSVTKICDKFCSLYPNLNRDLTITAAMFHDIGKLTELTPFPDNDYSDEGQLLGHIVIGAQTVGDRIREIEGFPQTLRDELLHCILSHHGELEYGSPKKPALAEAVALSFADNADAKLETIKEALSGVEDGSMKWQGFNSFLESNIRKTSVQ